MNAATTRNVISATMAHLIPCNDGSRFVFSHDFSDLLVGQMEATLEGEITNVRIRSNKLNNETITWPESLADDYLHRPSEDDFENICFYDLTSRYKKTFKIASSRQKISGENDGSSWCPFSVSQVIGYENVRWVSHKILY